MATSSVEGQHRMARNGCSDHGRPGPARRGAVGTDAGTLDGRIVLLLDVLLDRGRLGTGPVVATYA
jgi:hypothetical protein